MNNIWANRLIAGTKVWGDVPAGRREGVKSVLLERVERREITAEQYTGITGETYQESAHE